MKHLLNLLTTIVFIQIIGIYNSTAQQTQTVNTPNGSSVECEIKSEHQNVAYETSITQGIIDQNGYNAVIIGDASNLYNCHFYAWYLSDNEGATPLWMMPSKALVFLDKEHYDAEGADNSFLRTNSGSAEKILMATFASGVSPLTDNFINSDHSMDYSPDPDNAGRNWVSKWGPGALVRHGKYDHSYYKSSVEYQYYACNNQSKVNWEEARVNIPDKICTRTLETYDIYVPEIFNLVNISVTNTHLFSTCNPDEETKTLTLQPLSNAYGEFSVSFTLKNGLNKQTTISKTVSLGIDPSYPFTYITTNDPQCMCAWQDYYIGLPGTSEELDYDWFFMYGDVQQVSHGVVKITPYMNEGYLDLTITNGCGVSENLEVLYPGCGWCSGYFMAYPNPATTSLQVDITAEAIKTDAKIKEFKEMHPEKEKIKIPTPDFKEYSFVLYNNGMEMVTSGKAKNGKFKLDVSGFKRGNYFLVIDSGTSAPETHQIILE